MRWDYMARNPAKLAGKNPEPAPREVRAYTIPDLTAIAAELSTRYGRSPRSWRRLAFGPKSGPCSNDATSIEPPGS